LLNSILVYEGYIFSVMVSCSQIDKVGSRYFAAC